MSNRLQQDEFFMKRALVLAKKGFGKVAPNPMVGAVLVKNGKILAEGFHEYFGGPHAEVNLLNKMNKSQIQGARLYLTLEPCCFLGKTPPCTIFLISKGVKDLVVAMRDPNPKVNGKGVKMLKNNGVKIRMGVLETEARKLNQQFIKNIKTKLPFVSIKLGITLDGKIGPVSGKPMMITNQQSREQVHIMRSKVDAILTTSRTILNDHPHLGVRLIKGKDPLRVVIDSQLRTSIDEKVYRDTNVMVATTLRSPLKKRFAFQKKGIKLLLYKTSKVPLKKLLQDLYKLGVYSVMVEAGSHLVTGLLNESLADELVLFVAPKVFSQGISWLQDYGLNKLKKGFSLKEVRLKRYDDDVMISGTLVY